MQQTDGRLQQADEAADALQPVEPGCHGNTGGQGGGKRGGEEEEEEEEGEGGIQRAARW